MFKVFCDFFVKKYIYWRLKKKTYNFHLVKLKILFNRIDTVIISKIIFIDNWYSIFKDINSAKVKTINITHEYRIRKIITMFNI
jgi:hypothetical protein